MKKQLLIGISLLAVFLAGGAAQAVYKVKKPEQVAKPVFASKEEERLYRLGQGEILTEGGYLKKGVWATMEGTVQAPPEVVWRLFIQANDWKKYRLPDLIDCRAVDQATLDQVKETKKSEDFYQALGDKVVDPVAPRRFHSKWENYTFQFYDLPWPVSDKWFVIQNFADETRSAEGVYVTTWEKRAGNVRSLRGELKLEPFQGDKSKTLLRYHIKTNPGPIPRFMIKWGVKKSLPAAMRVIRRESLRLKSQGTR